MAPTHVILSSWPKNKKNWQTVAVSFADFRCDIKPFPPWTWALFTVDGSGLIVQLKNSCWTPLYFFPFFSFQQRAVGLSTIVIFSSSKLKKTKLALPSSRTGLNLYGNSSVQIKTNEKSWTESKFAQSNRIASRDNYFSSLERSVQQTGEFNQLNVAPPVGVGGGQKSMFLVMWNDSIRWLLCR